MITIEKPFTAAGGMELQRLNNWKIDVFFKELDHICRTISDLVYTIGRKAQSIEECRLMMSIPGIGAYSSLLIYSEIGGMFHFLSSNKLCVYAVTCLC